MGSRGPLPKRTEQSAGHRTKASRADKIVGIGPVPVPDADDSWHPRALAFYAALAASGQSRYYEPTDWELARMRCGLHSLIERAMEEGKAPSGQVLGELSKIDARLGVTESDRRRMRVEVERPEGDAGKPAAGDAVDAVMDRYRRLADESG